VGGVPAASGIGQESIDGFPEEFFAGITEKLFGYSIEQDDVAVPIDFDNRVGCCLEEFAEATLSEFPHFRRALWLPGMFCSQLVDGFQVVLFDSGQKAPRRVLGCNPKHHGDLLQVARAQDFAHRLDLIVQGKFHIQFEGKRLVKNVLRAPAEKMLSSKIPDVNAAFIVESDHDDGGGKDQGVKRVGRRWHYLTE
jgi:hypothetical protein